ncbi:hypothetical protein LOTGIDRAFT_165396 [Lottia gigantea]|uniref:Uncharacterized protein n=1 Tax=Lottia gigantea TaxID=225164 RepID=V3ZW55_LOTGI|nr:hypothetical protein LOTGIDRAFT_165396 [Lottia gigantea]ESO88612.1 hypothetical protein LOTGIDRAFT_165396 [Lottia gigantea]
MSMIIAQTPKTYFGSDIQKSLGSLPSFPWVKYPGENIFPIIITLVQVQDAISKSKTPNENRVPQTNTTLENNFFPYLFTEMVLEAGSNPIKTIKHPGEFETMLKTVLYPKNYDSVSGWIPDVGGGRVLKEPVRNVPNDANADRMRAIARNTIERVGRAGNHGFEKRVLQYNNVVENNRFGNYVN